MAAEAERKDQVCFPRYICCGCFQSPPRYRFYCTQHSLSRIEDSIPPPHDLMDGLTRSCDKFDPASSCIMSCRQDRAPTGLVPSHFPIWHVRPGRSSMTRFVHPYWKFVRFDVFKVLIRVIRSCIELMTLLCVNEMFYTRFDFFYFRTTVVPSSLNLNGTALCSGLY